MVPLRLLSSGKKHRTEGVTPPAVFLFPPPFLPVTPAVSPRFPGGFSQRDGTSLPVSILHNVGSAVHLVSTFTNKYFEIRRNVVIFAAKSGLTGLSYGLIRKVY